MFLGSYEHTIDAKGRIAIPAKFRGDLARGIVLVRGIEDCLYGYSFDTWEEKAHELEKSVLDPKKRNVILRRFFGTAQDCELDAQGRIVVPADFRRYANLAGDAMVLGVYKRFEIWNRARWTAYQTEMEAEDLSGIDLPF